MMWDECAGCNEKKTDMDFMQNQLDSIRQLIDDWEKDGGGSITAMYWSLSELKDKIYEVLER